jgi:hypothetical protein
MFVVLRGFVYFWKNTKKQKYQKTKKQKNKTTKKHNKEILPEQFFDVIIF